MTEISSWWYAVNTRPRWEKKIAKVLDTKGIENYCPVNKVTRQWSDRKKVILEPLFKCYVFVKIEDEKKWELYDLSTDPSETINLASKHPEKTIQMAELWEKEAKRIMAKPWPWNK